jgi:L-aminopeptidase/D-esterase-like protein
VVATDAPLGARNLERLARRAGFGPHRFLHEQWIG